MASKRPTTFSMRMPEDLNEKINAYAAEHSCTKAEAMTRFARAGIELEESGANSAEAPESMGEAIGQSETLAKIESRLEALQNLPTIESNEPAAIVPVDIRDKIQTYSKEHDCSEQDAMAYYARLGIQLSGEVRYATSTDVAELSAKLDMLAKDGASKQEQISHMAEMIASIREYTKPEEFELEGEVADDAEDVENHEPTPEELQQQADERTRQIVSDVMGEYLQKQNEEQEEQFRRASYSSDVFMRWLPILIAVLILLLVVVLVVILTR